MINLKTLTFYCDESCYQINDGFSHMAIASVYCRKDRKKEINSIIKEIKQKYKISDNTELKWGKVSPATLEMYKEIFSAIKSYKYLKFRIVVSDKACIKSEAKSRWYETMYYHLIEYPIYQLHFSFLIDKVDILSDVMNTHSIEQMKKVASFLKKHFKSKTEFVSKVCESKDVKLIQIADLLAGAATYKNRKLTSSTAKMELCNHIEKIFNVKLNKTSMTRNDKLSSYNVFVYDKKVNKDEL